MKVAWVGRFREEVRRVVGNRPLARVATDAGLPRDAIRSVLQGHDPRFSRVAELANALGLELYIGPPRGWEELESALRRTEEVFDRLRAQAKTAADAFTAKGALVPPGISSEIRRLPDAQPVPVRQLWTAEGGAPDLDALVKSYAYFRREWLSRHGLVADRCSVIRVMDESMEPTLPAGCAVLLDHNQRRRWEGRIFAIGMSGGWVIRRAGKDEAGNWLLMCDHPARGPEPWSNAEIIGEVKWMAREV